MIAHAETKLKALNTAIQNNLQFLLVLSISDHTMIPPR